MANTRYVLNKLAKGRVWRRIAMQRLTEPVHLNVASAFVWAFGSYRQKIAWDLIARPQYAFGVLRAADLAKAQGLDAVTVIEFGVASGAGLLNMAHIAERVTRETGVRVAVHGFDTGAGMPPAVDYRDHPDLYQQGDFVMDEARLRSALPANTTLHVGALGDTIPAFLGALKPAAPIGFVAVDVDYYSSTVEALECLRGDPELYLPLGYLYADDINLEPHNSKAGELLAFAEFNAKEPVRCIEAHPFFEKGRIFQRAHWVRQMFSVHIMDHPSRREPGPLTQGRRYIENPYLRGAQAKEEFFPE